MEMNVRNEVMISGAKALINLIPFAGGPLGSIIGDYQSYRKEKKLNEFLDSIVVKLQQHEDAISQLAPEYILNDDFFDVFENTLRKIIYERQGEKRIAYSNILANSIINEADYNDTELYHHLIDVLTPLHIRVLREFCLHTKTPDVKFEVFINHVMSAVKAMADFDEDIFDEVIGDLESRNLLHPFLSTYETQNGSGGLAYVTDNFVTTKGCKFLSYIS